MSAAVFLVGDVFDVMRTLPDDSVDLVATSPPFLGLRSYLDVGHAQKHREIGMEATPADYLDTMLELTAEWGRLLTPTGSLVVELGDTYAGAYAAKVHTGDVERHDPVSHQPGHAGTMGRNRLRDRQQDETAGILPSRLRTRRHVAGWPLNKSLAGIPHLYHLSLAYGRNILTGKPSPAGYWIVRNVVAWCKPNPTPGNNGDKFRPATTYITIATRAEDRYFDLEAVRIANPRAGETARMGKKSSPTLGSGGDIGDPDKVIEQNPGGGPPLDHWWDEPEDLFDEEAWLVAPGTYRGTHYAAWPAKLLERPILAMCPSEVCRQCGRPRRRLVESERHQVGDESPSLRARDEQSGSASGGAGFAASGSTTYTTVGWSDCGHDDYRRGHVLDPFGGSGTTAAVSTGHGRDCTLIDIDTRNVDLARERVGMFLTVPDQ